MKSITIAAWKNRQFRQRLNPEELARLPANPAGILELTAGEIENVAGAAEKTKTLCSWLDPSCTTGPICYTIYMCATVSKTPFICDC
jgi:mersacidin/lichenicidin family type 2 lantibiotic